MPTLYTDVWLRKLHSMYTVQSTRSICTNSSRRVLDACKTSQSFKFSQVIRFLDVIHASKDLHIVKELFGSVVTWENFIAKRGELMETYVKDCICYRDFLNCRTQQSLVPRLPSGATFASATSIVGDAGIMLALLELLELLNTLESDHRLLIIIVLAVYQQLFLDYSNSYLAEYSTCFPVDSFKNPAFLATSVGRGKKIINTFVPNYLWYLLAYDLYTLQQQGVTPTDSRQWNEYLDVINVSAMRSAVEHLGLHPAPVTMRSGSGKVVQLAKELISALSSKPFSMYRDSNNYHGRVSKVIERTNASLGNPPGFVLDDLMTVLSNKPIMRIFQAIVGTIVGPGVPDVTVGVTHHQVRAYMTKVNSLGICR